MHEPVGIIGIGCPESQPLLAPISLLAPAIAMGNRVVLVPSESAPLLTTDLYQIFDTSDLPDGVVNIVTGPKDELVKTLAQHDQVDALWYFGSAEGSKMVETAAADNMKRSWVSYGKAYDFADQQQGAGTHLLRRATEVKNIWIPYGDQLWKAGTGY
jgi:aldehyde dehydrogenase (NAD+)